MKSTLLTIPLTLLSFSANADTEKPNFVWIVCEDISPLLGCYDFPNAKTPNLDSLAEKGVRFTNAFSNAPVSGASRAGLITGMYAPSYGAQNFRTTRKVPSSIITYPEVLKEHGYYCLNMKTDYNSSIATRVKKMWDGKAVTNTPCWANKKENQPFMVAYNLMITHEGQFSEKGSVRKNHVKRNLVPEVPSTPLKDIILPDYQPDTELIRKDWACLLDNVTAMDKQVGEILAQLKETNEQENTIVFFYSDHGGNLSRSKRFLYDSGTHVPLIVYFPKKWEHLSPVKQGSTFDELVEFVDLPKTMLSLAGITPPEQMQGRIFCGKSKEKESEYIFFHRDRMDARYDCSRAISDGEFLYIRNFYPHRPQAAETTYPYVQQHNWNEWKNWYENQKGDKDIIRSAFFEPKSPTELFDRKKDKYQVHNLSNDKKHAKKEKEISDALDQKMIKIKDIGLIPESMMDEIEKNYNKTVYEYAQSDEYPIEKILGAAKLSSTPNEAKFLEALSDPHPIIRYWALYGLRYNKCKSDKAQKAIKQVISSDSSITNQIMAIEAGVYCGLSKKEMFDELEKRIYNIGTDATFLYCVNILQSSRLSDQYTLDNWKKLQAWATRPEVKRPKNGHTSYALRIIDEAIELYPKKPYAF